MQTYIKNILTVVRNISGIDEAVYSNIYDIEQTDKTVFVIIPGDITDNFTAYLVNGSIQLMSKVMLVLIFRISLFRALLEKLQILIFRRFQVLTC